MRCFRAIQSSWEYFWVFCFLGPWSEADVVHKGGDGLNELRSEIEAAVRHVDSKNFLNIRIASVYSIQTIFQRVIHPKQHNQEGIREESA